MVINPVFYRDHITHSEEMKIYEDLLLNLAANFLKRTISLVPILDEDSSIEIKPLVPSHSTNRLFIAYCKFSRLLFHKKILQNIKTCKFDLF